MLDGSVQVANARPATKRRALDERVALPADERLEPFAHPASARFVTTALKSTSGSCRALGNWRSQCESFSVAKSPGCRNDIHTSVF